ncbi:MAG: type I restriction endonuclease subunit R, partial [Prevotellaceae bacterium]|nr:type I restriction endonuclease subunit R [Prevotellaceae bacterium]
LVPLLEQMGWQRGVDFKGEVEFNAGRTKTNHSSDKRPDFCLHITERKDDIEAKVVLEVKKLMKNRKEIHEAFKQGRSYAKWGAVEVLVLVDMRQILVYERDKDYRFNEDKPKKYSWADMENPDKYAELKRILSNK